MNEPPDEFWRRKSLAEMSREEWESLCDGCGNCCRLKLQDRDTGEVTETEVACAYLDPHTAKCTDYANRQQNVPGCIELTLERLPKLDWLPPTCAYVLVAAGRDLAWWHPLVSGDPETVHLAGISTRGKIVSERDVEDFEEWFGDEISDWEDE